MKLRHLRIRVESTDGPYGVDIPFDDGMVVVWADNSMGKSTCVKSIIIALGLEAILTTSQTDLPLTPAMKSSIAGEHGRTSKVVESVVLLEMENAEGNRITIQRVVVGEVDQNLVTVIGGPALSSPGGGYTVSNYYLGRQGAASRELGFHFFLASFFNWVLPSAQTFDGRETLLYMQCIFPFLVVEQSRGWSTIQPPIPSQYRIKDVYKRGVEFLFDLDAHKIAALRAELNSEKARLEAEWASVIKTLDEDAAEISGKVSGVQSRPVSRWPVEVESTVIVPYESKWVSAEEKLEKLKEEYQQLVQSDIPRVQEIAASASNELVLLERLVKDREALYTRLTQSLEMERSEAESFGVRIAALEEDIKKNQDLRVLRDMGAKYMDHVTHGICPTCNQHVQDTLIPIEDNQTIMSLDDNINFLNEQKRAFGGAERNAKRRVQAREMQLTALQAELSELRDKTRALRQTLISDGRVPSVVAIRQRIVLERDINDLEKFIAKFRKQVDRLVDLSEHVRELAARRKSLPVGDTSDRDREKLELWARSFRGQLQQYGFGSLTLTDIDLAPDSYRPEYQGHDFPNSISSSDLIRNIWALRLGMLEVAREAKTNHPEFLIFDEPKQQGTRDGSFAELFKRASETLEAGQQVIVFTSESKDNLKSYLAGLPHSYQEFPGRVLTSRISQ